MVYVADTENRRIRRIGTDGIITTIAGTGVSGTGGDNGPATSAQFVRPLDVDVTADGAILVLDEGAGRVRRIGPDGVITTVAGSIDGFEPTGDGGPATAAVLGFGAENLARGSPTARST